MCPLPIGAAQAALLAVEEVNAAGGIHGKAVRLIQEDAQCKGTLAVSAFQKLVRFLPLPSGVLQV